MIYGMPIRNKLIGYASVRCAWCLLTRCHRENAIKDYRLVYGGNMIATFPSMPDWVDRQHWVLLAVHMRDCLCVPNDFFGPISAQRSMCVCGIEQNGAKPPFSLFITRPPNNSVLLSWIPEYRNIHTSTYITYFWRTGFPLFSIK